MILPPERYRRTDPLPASSSEVRRAAEMLAGAIMDHGAHVVIDLHQLVDAAAAPVAELVAGTAARRTVQRRRVVDRDTHGLAVRMPGRVGLFALAAEHAYQALGQHADEAG